MVPAEGPATQEEHTGAHGGAGEPCVSSLVHLVAGSQGVITKRIDLALLEGQELLSRTLRRAAWVALSLTLAAGAWFAMAACVVLLVNPSASPVLRFAAFGLLNAGGALALVALAMRALPHAPPGARTEELSRGAVP